MYDYLETPAVAVELDAVENNIQTLVENAANMVLYTVPISKPTAAWSWPDFSCNWGQKGLPAPSWEKLKSWQMPEYGTFLSAIR